ncbi:MAG: hypothetical protein CSA20_02160 [Deltaproteobacteria bacterium]|nr:MAG: hypothetical protein CSA20_02160 [Deltaproteobacteria bacterium]
MLYIPLTSTPIGWLVLGLGGYALYKAGKRKGEEISAASLITEAPASDSAKDTTTTDQTK